MSELVAVWSGTFRVFGVDVRCYVLNDGQRVIEAEDMARLFRSGGDLSDDDFDTSDLQLLAAWARGETG